MTPDKKPLTLFLAAPGSNMGTDAKWKRPDDVRRFFEKVVRVLSERLGRPVALTVEKERRQSGAIHTTMFRAIYDSDIFIGDLTGSNPNVCIEVGIRLALRRGITLLVNQDSEMTPFDVGHIRVIQYANGPDDDVIEKIIDFVQQALSAEDYCDSPILEVLDLHSVPRTRWAAVSGERAHRLLQVAEASADGPARLRWLREAVEIDPTGLLPRLRLAQELRRQEQYPESLAVLDEGIECTPAEATLHLERGLVLSRFGKGQDQSTYLHQAVESLRTAVALDPKSADAQASLGGALRRLALATDNGWELLLESGRHYRLALEIQRHAVYPMLNLARLGLLLGGRRPIPWDNDKVLEKAYHLCAFESVDRPDDYWLAFDLADTLLFRGDPDGAFDQYQRAVQLVPAVSRADVLRSPLSTLLELKGVVSFPDGIAQGLEQITQTLQQQIITHSRWDGGPRE